MNFRSVFTLGLAGAVALVATTQAQSGDRERERVRVRVRNQVVERLVETRAFQTVIEQAANDDPCRERGGDRDDYTFCEVREENMSAGPLIVDAGTNGGIRIDGWDRNEIHVVAVINTHARSDADAKALASGVQIQAGSGKVSSTGPSTARREGWSVSFRISVPRHNDLDLTANNGGVSISGVTGNIRFETSNGGVRLTDLGGDVRGETHNGGLSVMLGGARWDGAGLDVETTNGGVTLSIPDGYNVDLTTRTVNGGFRTEMPITVQGELTSRQGISTTLGAGGAPVRVRTTNGGLKINRR
ncbi:MAG: DUF4097 family beta strand repeat-containing protein [Vicinamibacterales bacterium]